MNFLQLENKEREQRKMSIFLADSFCTTNMTFLVYHPIAFDSREIIVSSFCMRQASPLIFSSETLLVEARISDIRAFGRGETVLRSPPRASESGSGTLPPKRIEWGLWCIVLPTFQPTCTLYAWSQRCIFSQFLREIRRFCSKIKILLLSLWILLSSMFWKTVRVRYPLARLPIPPLLQSAVKFMFMINVK